MTEKKGKKLVEPKYLALAVLLTILVIVVTFLSAKKQDNTKVTPTPSTLTEEKVEEEIKDGVYTNYTYGFKLKYDDNIFSKEIESTDNTTTLVTEGSEYLPKLVVSMQYDSGERFKEILDKAYTRCRGYKINEPFKDGLLVTGTGRKMLESDIGCAFSFNPEGATDVEPGWGHASLFDINEKIISINISVWNQEQLSQFEEAFKNLFNSVELLN